jgi:hypothetical protein
MIKADQNILRLAHFSGMQQQMAHKYKLKAQNGSVERRQQWYDCDVVICVVMQRATNVSFIHAFTRL